jgi:prevent-host-death family protein
MAVQNSGGSSINISISEAKAQLTELARRAEAGEDIVLTRHGRPVLRLVPVQYIPSTAEKRDLFANIMQSGRAKAVAADEDAARSQDFLYDDEGLPG